MIKNVNDNRYKEIVNHILSDKEFVKIGSSYHHGTDRLTHSIRVSYYSYLIARKLGLDYKTSATAGLLHDYFLTNNYKNLRERTEILFNHPKTASDNAVKRFNISEKEQDIIKTHMFPLNLKPSKSIEGWIVSLVDKVVCIAEFGVKFRYASTLWLIFIFNIIK